MRIVNDFDQRKSSCHLRLRVALFAIAVSLATALFAQSTPSQGTNADPSAPAQNTRLTGTVINAVTGEPVSRALVRIFGIPTRSAFTDADGRFQLEGAPIARHGIVAQKPGFFSERDLHPESESPLETGTNPAPVMLKLYPEAVLSGKVATSTGVPLESVPVNLTYLNIQRGRRIWESKGTTLTDEDGHFRFANLRPGAYYVSAGPFVETAHTSLDLDLPPKTGFPEAYYPGVPDLAFASAIQLQPGDHTEANFSLREVPAYAVSGVVSGYPARQGVSLQLLDSSGNQLPDSYQFSEENGRFDFRALPAGNYVLRASSQLTATQPLRAELAVNLANNLYNLHLALAPAPVIPVTARFDDVGAPSSNPNLVRSSSLRAFSLVLLGASPGAGENYAIQPDAQNPREKFLQNVAPGRYSVTLEAPAPWYLASAEYGSTNLLNDDLVISANASTQPITIVLRNDSAILTGTVAVPDGFNSRVTIIAVPARLSKASPSSTIWFPARGKNSSQGTFFLDGLTPGDYALYAFDRADAIEYANRDVLQNYASQATQVNLAAGQRTNVTLNLIRIDEAAP